MATGDTSNFLNWVEIKNFKSIKDLRMDCKRVNVFIGKPNVGKSNILEALGLLGAGYSTGRFMGGLARYGQIKHLFNDNDSSNELSVFTNLYSASLSINTTPLSEKIFNPESEQSGTYSYRLTDANDKEAEKIMLVIDNNAEYREKHQAVLRKAFTSKVKKYEYQYDNFFSGSFSEFLLPPNGKNLFAVMDKRENLKNEFGKLFQEQQLELVLSRDEQSIELQRRSGYYVTKYPYFSIADTFRRFMFYVTAIESNENSVLVLEEPEVHSFPPYTQELAYRMIYDEKNQYFISTHSPYMLHPFIEKMDFKDLNIFITYYKDYQTYVKALTEDELTDVLDFSTNVFFNLEKFESQ